MGLTAAEPRSIVCHRPYAVLAVLASDPRETARRTDTAPRCKCGIDRGSAVFSASYTERSEHADKLRSPSSVSWEPRPTINNADNRTSFPALTAIPAFKGDPGVVNALGIGSINQRS